MSEWISVNKRLPEEGQIIWAYFGKDDRPGSKLVMYTPRFIAKLCEESEGQWKGMGSTDFDNWTHWVSMEPPDPPM